jgi:hypothetical protein
LAGHADPGDCRCSSRTRSGRLLLKSLTGAENRDVLNIATKKRNVGNIPSISSRRSHGPGV